LLVGIEVSDVDDGVGLEVAGDVELVQVLELLLGV
jgi:hypothetical protein